jgi:DNA processing protein
MLSSAGGRMDPHRLACAALSYLAEPDDAVLGTLLGMCEPAEMVAAIRAGRLPDRLTASLADCDPADRAAVTRAIQRWRIRLPALPDDQSLAMLCRGGIRLVCPSDPEWPPGLDRLVSARPYALWLRGNADLAFACMRSVSMVGSRAATGYGTHVAGEIAADLSERGWALVSGGAYGIDAAVHRGALITGGITIAVLACGVDHPYPAGHADLFEAITDDGLVISEWPPGSRPTRLRFLVRNRVIAALTRGTVVVEAGERSGALNTARHAAELGKPLMAVPGPVTSAQSAGCHKILRDWNGGCVTSATDITAMLASAGEELPGSSPVVPPRLEELTRDDLDLDSARVLDAFPARGAVGVSTIAVRAGVDLDTVLSRIGRLAGAGFIQSSPTGWRLTRKAYK